MKHEICKKTHTFSLSPVNQSKSSSKSMIVIRFLAIVIIYFFKKKSTYCHVDWVGGGGGGRRSYSHVTKRNVKETRKNATNFCSSEWEFEETMSPSVSNPHS